MTAVVVGTPKVTLRCAECGDTQVLVNRGGRWVCWNSPRCDERQARAAGYGLNGSTS